MASAAQIARFQDITNESLVKRVLEGDTALFEVLMRRHNQRLYRIARAVLREDAEAEDVMQDAYVNAYENLGQFEGTGQFLNLAESNCPLCSACALRKRKRVVELDTIPDSERETHAKFTESAAKS